MQLPDSRLYTLIDEPREFALFFLEGQRLIHDLALVHGVRGPGFAYFRDVVLSVQPMIALLKHGEQLGFYIDSADPFFRLKIETGHNGATRCALVPDSFHEFPATIHGIVRMLKLFPHNRPPYESVIKAEGLALREIVNRVLRESYQTNSAVMVAGRSDQSLMLHQLPPLAGDKDGYDYSLEALRARRNEIREAVGRIFAGAMHGRREVEAAFGEIGFRPLTNRRVRFLCACSRERVVRSLLLASGSDYEELFDPGQLALDITCEYCKSKYEITRTDLDGAASPMN